MIRPAVDPVPLQASTVQLLVECPGFAEVSPYLRPAVVYLLKVNIIDDPCVTSLFINPNGKFYHRQQKPREGRGL